MPTEQVSTPIEEFRPVKGYEGIYSVSNLGRVRVDRCGQRNGMIKKNGLDVEGYHRVGLCVRGKAKWCLVSRLVAFAFIPLVQGKQFVNHKNGVKTDNRPENLEWCTFGENMRHAVDVLGHRRGERSWNAKLKDSQIPTIRKLYSDGGECKDIAKQFGVNIQSIRQIVFNKSWTHLPLTEVHRGNKGNTKLTNDEAKQVVQMANSGVNKKEIGRQFGITRQAVVLIIRRVNLKHLL